MADRAHFDVGGPVLAEVFVVWADPSGIHLSGPCGPAAWHVEVGEGQDPMAVVAGIVEKALGPPLLLHSTSWRRAKTGVVLTFFAVVERDAVAAYESVPVGRSDLARGGATTSPESVVQDQVLEHALRHLAWLAKDDPVVGATLAGDWKAHLCDYVPEPFRSLA